MFDGVGMGLGFTIALVIVGVVREFLGAGTAFGFAIAPESWKPMEIFVKAPGAFLVLAIVVAIMNGASIMTRANDLVNGGCDGKCAGCAMSCANKGLDAATDKSTDSDKEGKA